MGKHKHTTFEIQNAFTRRAVFRWGRKFKGWEGKMMTIHGLFIGQGRGYDKKYFKRRDAAGSDRLRSWKLKRSMRIVWVSHKKRQSDRKFWKQEIKKHCTGSGMKRQGYCRRAVRIYKRVMKGFKRKLKRNKKYTLSSFQSRLDKGLGFVARLRLIKANSIGVRRLDQVDDNVYFLFDVKVELDKRLKAFVGWDVKNRTKEIDRFENVYDLQDEENIVVMVPHGKVKVVAKAAKKS